MVHPVKKAHGLIWYWVSVVILLIVGDPCYHLTYWGRVTHLCVCKLTSVATVNGLSHGRRQTIIWNNAGILLIRPLGTNFSEFLIEIQTFSFKKIRLKMSSAKWRPFCLGFNVLTDILHCNFTGAGANVVLNRMTAPLPVTSFLGIWLYSLGI